MPRSRPTSALDPETTALLVIDVQNIYLAPKDTPEETARWQPFYDRMRRDRDPEHRAADRRVPARAASR